MRLTDDEVERIKTRPWPAANNIHRTIVDLAADLLEAHAEVARLRRVEQAARRVERAHWARYMPGCAYLPTVAEDMEKRIAVEIATLRDALDPKP